MRAYDIIRKKRAGSALSGEELSFLVTGFSEGRIPDYQVSAFLMAVFFRGMTEEETFGLTDAMLGSGAVLDLSDIPGPKIDKHSTGGVGDKVTLVLAPLLASAGIVVPMIAGRALAHTGGTLDKLEAIPGFRTSLSVQEFKENLRRVGVSIMGQTEEVAPVDRKLYALRDVTATVDSIPLIASSIMSKKLAEGIDGLVLDVKCGSGAFMKTPEEARTLADTMVKIGNARGVKTVAVITDMDQPLGATIGNSLEIRESISALHGEWARDLREVTLTLGAWMLHIGKNRGGTPDEETIERSRRELGELLASGAAFRKFVAMVDAQQGDSGVVLRPDLIRQAGKARKVVADREGYILRIDAEKIGIASMLLGAGRETMADPVDRSAGIILAKKVGDHCGRGEQVAELHYNREDGAVEAGELFLSALEIEPRRSEPKSVILEVVR
ncbi:MAG: thymidine phosphorylase [Nitrospirae bacterium]|nr:thymidine phosphorylase [Nitrospirota bacterium]